MKTGYRSDCRQAGVTLIELLIGLAVGLFIILAATSVFTGTLRSSKQNLKMTHLDQQLRAAMDVMTRHIRRAGYYGLAPTTSTDLSDYGPNNPFQINGYQMTLGPIASCDPTTGEGCCDPTTGECPCITFSYDGGADGGTPSGTDDLYGFRYGSANKRIEMRKDASGPPGCTDGASWEGITDPAIQVERLTFQYEKRHASDPTKPLAMNLTFPAQNLTEAGCDSVDDPSLPGYNEEACLQLRTVIITLDGDLASDENTTMSLRERVKVRNDRYCTEDDNPGC
jgi:prepilin peptidase dependent protein B